MQPDKEQTTTTAEEKGAKISAMDCRQREGDAPRTQEELHL